MTRHRASRLSFLRSNDANSEQNDPIQHQHPFYSHPQPSTVSSPSDSTSSSHSHTTNTNTNMNPSSLTLNLNHDMNQPIHPQMNTYTYPNTSAYLNPNPNSNYNETNPTTDLLKLITHITTQTAQARRLFDSNRHLLPAAEADWMLFTITDTEDAAREASILVEASRIDFATHGGRMGLSSRMRWALRDSTKLKERRARLFVCHQSLVGVMSRLTGLEASPPPVEGSPPLMSGAFRSSSSSFSYGSGNGNGNGGANGSVGGGLSMPPAPLLLPVTTSKSGESSAAMSPIELTAVRSPVDVTSSPLKVSSAWDEGQRQDPGMEAVWIPPQRPPKVPLAVTQPVSQPSVPLHSKPTVPVVPSVLGVGSLPQGNGNVSSVSLVKREKVEPTSLDSDMMDLLSWRFTQGGD